MITISIPPQLRQLSGGRDSIKIDTKALVADLTLRMVLTILFEEIPGSRERLIRDDGRLNRFIRIFIDDIDSEEVLDRQRGKGDLLPFDKEELKRIQEARAKEVLDPLNCKLTGYESISILPALAGG